MDRESGSELLNRTPHLDLPVFQGPMDLLLHLITQHKIDIYDIPIAMVADQFVAAIRQMEALDIEVASEFLVLAAQLLYLKSKELLPKPKSNTEKPEEGDDYKQELVDRLIAYRAIKEAAEQLRRSEGATGSRYFRLIDPEEIVAGLPLKDPLESVAFGDVLSAFRKVLERADVGDEETDVRFVSLEAISIDVVISDVLRRILLQPKGVFFGRLLRYQSRVELVMAFLALLELLKEGKIKATQESSAGRDDIFLVPTMKAFEFDEFPGRM
ncbi:MAG: segregation/condensation protein A [Peptococcaceae bacterium]|nr:segregation/condensation protein A [Peptococcaceae bacterium]